MYRALEMPAMRMLQCVKLLPERESLARGQRAVDETRKFVNLVEDFG